jgi:uncharacterized protein (DUF3820 family)
MSDSEAFTAACGFVMPFGKHQGKTVARIGASREGLLYLDWMIGQPWFKGDVKEAVWAYLQHPAIEQQLNAYLDD